MVLATYFYEMQQEFVRMQPSNSFTKIKIYCDSDQAVYYQKSIRYNKHHICRGNAVNEEAN